MDLIFLSLKNIYGIFNMNSTDFKRLSINELNTTLNNLNIEYIKKTRLKEECNAGKDIKEDKCNK